MQYLEKYNSVIISGVGGIFSNANKYGLDKYCVDINMFDEEYKSFLVWDKNRQTNLDAKLNLIAVKKAFEASNINTKDLKEKKIGIVFNSSFGCFNDYEVFEDSMDNNEFNVMAFTCGIASHPASAVSILWGVKGACITTADSSAFFPGLDEIFSSLDKEYNMFIVGAWNTFSKSVKTYYKSEPIEEGAIAYIAEPASCYKKRVERDKILNRNYIECIKVPACKKEDIDKKLGELLEDLEEKKFDQIFMEKFSEDSITAKIKQFCENNKIFFEIKVKNMPLNSMLNFCSILNTQDKDTKRVLFCKEEQGYVEIFLCSFKS